MTGRNDVKTAMPGYIESGGDPTQREIHADDKNDKVPKLLTWKNKVM